MPRNLTRAFCARYWREWLAERKRLHSECAEYRSRNYHCRAVKRHRLGVAALTEFDNGPTRSSA